MIRRNKNDIGFTDRIRMPGRTRSSQADAKQALERTLAKTGYYRIKQELAEKRDEETQRALREQNERRNKGEPE